MEADSLGKKIRRLRINNCLSQARLAEAVDVSTNYIGQIERGDRTPSLDTVIALCNALHASVDYVVSDDISTRDDEIMTDIRAQLVKLTPDEKQYFYHMIVSYIQLKEENARAQKRSLKLLFISLIHYFFPIIEKCSLLFFSFTS